MRLSRVTDDNAPVYVKAIAILHEAIAPEAQLPETRFSDLLAAGKYQLFAYTQGDDVRGVALVYFSNALQFAWLDYFAVRSDLRGQGLGSGLFREIVQLTSMQSSRLQWLLFEVDDDCEGDAQREEECKRRVAFYRRLGARVLENVAYKFPSATSAPIKIRLMAYQLNPSATLAPSDLRRSVQEIFLNIHGRGNDDRLLRWFESSLPHALEMK